MEISQAISRKRAVREYADRIVPEEVIQKILDAGRRAQSSRNSQPWHFIVLRNPENLEALSKTGKHASHVAKAGVCVAFATEDPNMNSSILFDVGQSAAYMQLVALNEGVGSCIVKLNQSEKAEAILEVPTEYQVHFAISFGYPLRKDLVTKPATGQGRRNFDDVVHWEKWKNT